MLLGLQTTGISGQAVFTNFNDTVPLDESITYGKLDNGLIYYIKPLPEPQDEVNLRFYLKTGSDHQDPDQLNMAHFIEHMAFKSTKHFPRGIRYELSTRKNLNMGMYDVGGTAGAYESRYKFDAPANNKEALKTGLLWFKDISSGLHLKNEEIDTERGVLVQEFLLRTPDDMQETYARRKLITHMVPCMESYSNFMEHHESFDPERLKQFYKDWYRPDLMALVVTGKIDDVDALEKQIKNQFSNIPPRVNPRELPTCQHLFFKRPPRFIIVEKVSDTQQSLQKVEIELLFRDKGTPEMISSEEGVERLNEIEFLIDIIRKRFRETTNVYNNFFDFRIRHTFKSSIAPSSFKILISSHNNKEREALQTFIRVIEQVQRYGVTESEFTKVKRNKIDQLEKTDLSKSRYWHDEIKHHLVHNEALPSDKHGYIKNSLLDYEISEFEEFITGINFEMPDIGVIAPTNHQALSYTEEEIRSWVNEIKEGPIVPYIAPETPNNVMSTSEVKKLQEHRYEDKGIGESGARELLLENGVRVLLKSFNPSPALFEKQLILHGFNNNGALNYQVKDYFSAVNAPMFIKNSGVGALDKFKLQRFLTTTSLFLPVLNLYINNFEAGIKLNADLEDLEEMLQLVYLFFSRPREDTIAFQDWKAHQSLYYQSRSLDKVDFNNKIKKIIGDNSGASLGTERYLGLEDTDFERGFEIYKELFGDSQDFTFTITGDFPMDSVMPLVNKYLGNLPSIKMDKTKISVRNYNLSKPAGPILVEFKSSDTFSANYNYRPIFIVPNKDQVSWKEKIVAEVLGRVLNEKVWGLRFEKGYGLYDVAVVGKYNINMEGFEFAADFSCTRDEYPLLREEFHEIIEELKVDLITQQVLEQNLMGMKARYNSSGLGNSHERIQERLYDHHRFGVSWVDKDDIPSYIESLTPDDVLKAAQKYFKAEYLYEFVMTK